MYAFLESSELIISTFKSLKTDLTIFEVHQLGFKVIKRNKLKNT